MQSSLINAICSLEGSLRGFDRGLRLFVASAATIKLIVLITRHPQVVARFSNITITYIVFGPLNESPARYDP